MNVLTDPFFQWPCTATMLRLVILKKSRILSKIPLTFFQQKPKFWTFKKNLLIRLHSALNWLLLTVFNETKELLRITNLVFEFSFFCNVSRKITNSVAFYCKFAFIDNFEGYFFSENLSVFFRKTKIWTVWENLLFQSHSTANLLTLSLFWKKKIFSKKPIHFLKKTPNFRKFWDFSLFQRPCSVTLLLLAILKKSTNFSITQSVFFSKKDQFLNVLRNPIKSVAFCINLAAFSGS